MPNPLWVDARDYLTGKGSPVTTGSLNAAMGFLAQNPDARPSYAKASPDAATSIGAGLGMPTDDFAAPIDDGSFQDSAQYIPNAVSSSPQMHGGTTGYPAAPPPPAPVPIKATSLAAPKPTSYTPPQNQARPQPRSAGTPTRSERTAATRTQPTKLPVNNRATTAQSRSDPITTPVSTGSPANIHATPANVAPAVAPSSVNPAIPDVSNGAYAPGGLEDVGTGTLAAGGGLAAALLGMILSRGRAGRVPNAPRIPGAGASPLPAQMSKYGTPGVFEDPLAGAAPYGTPGAFAGPKAAPTVDPLANAAPYGTPGAFETPNPLANASPYGTPAVMADRPPNQSVTPYSGAAPATTPPQLEDLIAELTTAPPNRNIMGTNRGTKPPTPPPARPKAEKAAKKKAAK